MKCKSVNHKFTNDWVNQDIENPKDLIHKVPKIGSTNCYYNFV